MHRTGRCGTVAVAEGPQIRGCSDRVVFCGKQQAAGLVLEVETCLWAGSCPDTIYYRERITAGYIAHDQRKSVAAGLAINNGHHTIAAAGGLTAREFPRVGVSFTCRRSRIGNRQWGAATACAKLGSRLRRQYDLQRLLHGICTTGIGSNQLYRIIAGSIVGMNRHTTIGGHGSTITKIPKQ